ncbi:PAS domain S-box protein [Rhodocytophaga aerolata]|uniref:Oxygen sensor histidine kinase NreB n=1 Tax=Rhodocytophaga aerolata TaxID=455078 RepID=A0ABT8QYR0_9BACT|nr:PAS domain S-box protein [Rhodocytophaga aerolata]MDO1444982.1 PAS domain S-box protein [Rhodocytophaga aerolata]
MKNREEEKINRIEALRSKAEKLLEQQRMDIPLHTVDPATLQELMQELHVRQVELEMQNEELLESRVTIEKSLNDYASLYQFAPVAYFTLDKYGAIVQANIAASHLTGYPTKSLVKKPLRSLLPPSQASAFYEFINKIFTNGTKQVSQFHIRNKTGNLLSVHMEAQSLHDKGHPHQCLLAMVDLTAQKEAENKVHREKAFSESLLENSIDGIVAFDTEGKITSWNKTMETLTGKHKAEVTGRRIVDLFPNYQVNAEGQAIQKALQGETSILHNHPFGIRNGFYEISTVPLYEQEFYTTNQVITGGLCIVHDVTDRIKIEQERISLKLKSQQELLNAILQAQEEERKRIAESLHNGIGQILYAAQLSLQQIKLSETPLSTEELRKAKKQTEELLKEAIRSLRQASHELVPVLLEQFGLAEAINDFCSRFSHTGINITCHGFEQSLNKPLELAIYRIAQELINNIVRHSQATRARLEMFMEGGQLVLEAQDNGKGLEEGALQKKGIGLKTIQNRVKLLGGTMDIDSTPNKGTLLTVTLPISHAT